MAQRVDFSTIALPPLEQKLRRNFYEKALKEAGITPKTPTAFDLPPPSEPLHLHISAAEAQGKRPRMEDAYFDCKIPGGFLMGVFDGHGEKGVIAAKAAQTFQSTFPSLLKESPDDKKKIFKTINISIHESLTEKTGGTTALVCYFDEVSHRLYTSNLGDSKAVVFRKAGPTIEGIPVSIERNWGSPKDQERARIAYNEPDFFNKWIQKTNPKQRRFPFALMGVNVSRSLGDKDMRANEQTATSQNPHVTLFQLAEGDLLVLGCDGLWDVTTPQELIDKVLTHSWDTPQLAQALVDYALKTSTDNVTVICAWAKTSLPELGSLNSTQSFEDSE